MAYCEKINNLETKPSMKNCKRQKKSESKQFAQSKSVKKSGHKTKKTLYRFSQSVNLPTDRDSKQWPTSKN